MLQFQPALALFERLLPLQELAMFFGKFAVLFIERGVIAQNQVQHPLHAVEPGLAVVGVGGHHAGRARIILILSSHSRAREIEISRRNEKNTTDERNCAATASPTTAASDRS